MKAARSKSPEETEDALARSRRRLEENEANADGVLGLGSAVTNFIVIGGFACFAFVVQYVIQSLAATAD